MQAAKSISKQAEPDYKALYENALSKIETLQLELLQLRKLIFLSRHEKFVSTTAQPNQPLLFDVAAVAETETKTQTIKEHTKTKVSLVGKHKGRNGFPAHLRREETVVEPQGLDTGMLKQIGEDLTERLAYKPSELYVKIIRRPKYILEPTQAIVQAPAPVQAIEKCSADNSLLAQIAVEKYVDHLPLYRQIQRYKRQGVTINDSTVGDWVKALAQCIKPLFDKHVQIVLQSLYLHADETSIKVLDSDKKNASHQGYYWVYLCHNRKLALFDYQPGRGREGPSTILQNFKGYLQTDGYQVYEKFDGQNGITLFHCMAHARRKFHEAQQNNPDIAEHALAEIQKLYALERQAKEANLCEQDLAQLRNEQALPILSALGKWMKERYLEVLPKSAIGKALGYSIERWEKLSLYATTGHLNIDNNPVENTIRPIALGRKNYLFAGSHAAAQRAAMFYSLFATCRMHNINPYQWLSDVLEKLPNWKINQIDQLLPQNWNPKQ